MRRRSPSSSTVIHLLPNESMKMEPSGVVNADEWSGARVVDFEGGQLLLQSRAGGLEVALRTEPLFVASLCVGSSDRISILHASSAVGRGVYARRGGAWELQSAFEWRLRGSAGAPASRTEQEAHLAAEGWAANTVTTGTPGHMEFRISPAVLGGSRLRMALGLMLAGDGTDLRGWPMAPGSDACTTRSTIAGPLEERADFRPDAWVELRLPGGR